MENIPDDALASLEETIASLEKKEKGLQSEIRKAKKILKDLKKSDASNRTAYNDYVDEKLSHAAKYAIEVSEGPLESPTLIAFLMELFRKPKPSVLPIVRKYTAEVDGLMEQLQQVKDSNNELHSCYQKEQRRLDKNLNERIDKLIKNIEKELGDERKSGLTQTSMNDFMEGPRPKRRAAAPNEEQTA